PDLWQAAQGDLAPSPPGPGTARPPGARRHRSATPPCGQSSAHRPPVGFGSGHRVHRKKRKQATKPSKQVPIRTFADWNDPQPGSLEIDFVAHGGSSMHGTFRWSLVATDVCSGWTEAVPLLAREQSLVTEGLEVIGRQLPIPIRGIDSDND